jgi:hypothetical protein
MEERCKKEEINTKKGKNRSEEKEREGGREENKIKEEQR